MVCCALFLSACGRQQQAPPPASTPEVAVVTVAAQPIVLTIEMPGLTSPFLIADVRPQVNGLVLKRLFTEGSDVKQGQQLYQIDPAPFQAALDNAKAALGRAEASLPALRSRTDRFKQALVDKAVSQQTSTTRTRRSNRLRRTRPIGRRWWRAPASTWIMRRSFLPFRAELGNRPSQTAQL